MRRRPRAAPAVALSAALLGSGCMSAGLWVEPPPAPRAEAPTPPPFEGKQAPALVRTEHPALLAAPELSASLYFYEPDGLWYRRWRGRWYQAFTWDGHWFPPRRVPEVVRALDASKTPAPSAPRPAPAP